MVALRLFEAKSDIGRFDYDPTRRVIELAWLFGLAFDLKHPDENEIKKAKWTFSFSFSLLFSAAAGTKFKRIDCWD